MINSWNSLIESVDSNKQQLISGEWFTVRFLPDRITGEVFNIGVVFIDSEKKSHYKLLDNANAFSCLFGDKGSANINFLLKVVDEVLSNNNYSIIPSPHIQYSIRQTAQGTSIDSILDDLYRSMVTLICKHDEKDIKKESSTLSTKDLRNKVFGMMRKQYPKFYDKVLIDHPFEISNSKTKQSMMVDMPIRYYNVIDSSTRNEYYGTVVSAAYVDPVHRTYNLNYLGVTNVMNCLEILGKDIYSALIIYLPPVDEFQFTEEVHNQANKELNKCLYGLEQMRKEGYHLKIEIEESTEACYKRTIEFVT